MTPSKKQHARRARHGLRPVIPSPQPQRTHNQYCPKSIRPGSVECWCSIYEKPKEQA